MVELFYFQCYDNLVFGKWIRPIQWLTPMIGTFQSCAMVRATTAVDTKGPPIPGPVHEDKTGGKCKQLFDKCTSSWGVTSVCFETVIHCKLNFNI